MNTMTIKEASTALGIAQQTLRMALQTEQVPYLGFAIKGKKQWTYTISREAVEKLLRGELFCRKVEEDGNQRV